MSNLKSKFENNQAFVRWNQRSKTESKNPILGYLILEHKDETPAPKIKFLMGSSKKINNLKINHSKSGFHLDDSGKILDFTLEFIQDDFSQNDLDLISSAKNFLSIPINSNALEFWDILKEYFGIYESKNVIVPLQKLPES